MEVSNHVPRFLQIYGLLIFLLSCCSGYLLKSGAKVQQKVSDKPTEKTDEVEISEWQQNYEIFTNKDFWIMFVFCCLCFALPLFLMNNYKMIALSLHLSDHQASIIGTISAIVNALSRLVVGTLSDKYSNKDLAVVLLGSLVVSSRFILSSNVLVFGLAYLICTIGYGGLICLSMSLSVNYFGKKAGIRVLGFVTIGSAMSSLAAYFLQVSMTKVDYGYMIDALGVASVVAMSMMFFLGREKRTEKVNLKKE